ncbi:unnamed protein product [Cyclocybe aegerita]|uniref:Protein kinase domain-containing protein n=1 Tax=Cyclocybe aegerita TaxID=1973307 RepID=A0A8S0XIW5_CYCAE|nr:unnamed protein product [Cyclocybe aegerita]
MTITAPHGDPAGRSVTRPTIYDGEGMKSTFRDRSRSPARGAKELTAQGAEEKMEASWWGDKHVARPWQDAPKRKQTVPAEQTQALETTRQKVAKAVVSALGTGADIVHEALFLGVELLDFAPIPGLQAAARTILNIWDAAQQVDMNRLGCLRLTERCADILISIREEVHEAGDVLGEELADPIAKLEESYIQVLRFMQKQTNRPWLKRYLKRDEILRDIAGCDSSLRDALALFNTKIQIRILKEAREAEKRREADARAILDAILGVQAADAKTIVGTPHEPLSDSPYLVSTEYSTEVVTDIATSNNALGLIHDSGAGPSRLSSTDVVLPDIEALQTVQNTFDNARDLADLRQLMRAALQTSSDAEMVEVLQVKRQEMPEAIKTLQRAHERLAEKESEGSDTSSQGKTVLQGRVVKRISIKEVDTPQGGLQRSATVVSIESATSSSSSAGGSSSSWRRDTLDREFIENGIDALRRMSRGYEASLPSWTITKYEVDRDEKIGIGFFSDVYKGTWRGRTVAIKVLAESTPRKLFVREMGIWKTLRHANVLPLYGASSATGDPPWFFVSPYLKNGSLVEHLKRVLLEKSPPGLGLRTPPTQIPPPPLRGAGGRALSLPAAQWKSIQGLSPVRSSIPSPPGSSRGKSPPHDSADVQREWDLFRFMHEIAKGMAYLHGQGVLHGDLKAANVLVDDKYRCIISDFGQSEMKSEAYRISGSFPARGTLRWQPPEMLSGESQLTAPADVWAFSICCVEILTMGDIPWPNLDDDSVRHFLLKDNSRPPVPRNSRFNIPAVQELLRTCWDENPEKRPTFTKIARDLRLVRKSFGHEVDSPHLPPIVDLPEHKSSPSPDMRPSDLPQFLQGVLGPAPDDVLVGSFGSHSTYQTARDSVSPQPHQHEEASHPESTVATEDIKMPEPVFFTPASSSRSSSISIPAAHGDGRINLVDLDGYESPPPIDERLTQTQNERRYRLLLTHEYHPSLVLPLWEPTPVELGAVGYLWKPRGEFVTLFNANRPQDSEHPGIRRLPRIDGYGRPTINSQRHDRRTVAQKAMDMLYNAGRLTFLNSSSENISRRYSYSLKSGHKAAYLCTETTEYRYMETLDAPRMWFQLNVDAILAVYGRQYQIQREDIMLVIGTLRAPNHALFVSHSHPEGHAHFNVYSNPHPRQPWGLFTTDTDISRELGPSYESEDSSEPARRSASKVSNYGGQWDAVLLARLRFKPDSLEPTSK